MSTLRRECFVASFQRGKTIYSALVINGVILILAYYLIGTANISNIFQLPLIFNGQNNGHFIFSLFLWQFATKKRARSSENCNL